MPELPEVETTKRGIEPHIVKKKINSIYIGKHDLRIKFNKSQKNKILNTKIIGVRRKAKYISNVKFYSSIRYCQYDSGSDIV